MTMSNFFISFEGGEGAGKSTQIKLLYQSLIANGLKTIHTREPGGSENAERIRELIVKGNHKYSPTTELLLHMSARSDHIDKIIRPALNEGKNVLCDRFIDSTVAYQGFGLELGEQLVLKLHETLFGKFYPNLTFFLDIDIETGLKRAHARNSNENRYENMDLEFHKKLNKAFYFLSEEHKDRFVRIEANSTIEKIHQQIIKITNKKFGLHLDESENVHQF